ncbi:MAG: helix-turn-helix domain-containing protein [Bacteroidales bacterium]|nr:helix-turn-helix domain-containing protein [Bacteroidales bacterium]
MNLELYMMLKRIALILQTQNLTVSQFADRIGVQRSALSHVLGGRNNPSLDFVTKILRTFPEIRSQWLLFGEGKMYDAMAEARPAEEAAVAVPPEVVETPPAAAPEMPPMPVEMPMAASETEETAPEPEMPLPDMAGFAPVQAEDSRLVKVVFFYSDGRFEEYARR